MESRVIAIYLLECSFKPYLAAESVPSLRAVPSLRVEVLSSEAVGVLRVWIVEYRHLNNGRLKATQSWARRAERVETVEWVIRVKSVKRVNKG